MVVADEGLAWVLGLEVEDVEGSCDGESFGVFEKGKGVLLI